MAEGYPTAGDSLFRDARAHRERPQGGDEERREAARGNAAVDPVRLEERADQRPARADAAGSRGRPEASRQAAQGVDRSLCVWRPDGPGRRGEGGARDPRVLPSADDARCGNGRHAARHHRGERLHLLEGSGPPDERAHGAPPRASRREARTGDSPQAAPVTLERSGGGPRLDEIEVKLPCEDLDEVRRRPTGLGAIRAAPLHFESNDLYDDDDGRLSGSGRALRLRRADGRAILTYKGPARFSEGVKIREERETVVSDG